MTRIPWAICILLLTSAIKANFAIETNEVSNSGEKYEHSPQELSTKASVKYVVKQTEGGQYRGRGEELDKRGAYHDDRSWQYTPDARGKYVPDDSGLYSAEKDEALWLYRHDSSGSYQPDERGRYVPDSRGQ